MLKIKNLSVKAGKKQILENICLNLRPSEVQVLMGPNGSGKTTLAQALAGINKVQGSRFKVQADGISVSLDGKDLLSMSVDERAKAGLFVTFQNPVSVAGVKVFDFLWEIYLSFRGVPRILRGTTWESMETRTDLKVLHLSRDCHASLAMTLERFKNLIVKEAKKLGLTEKVLDRGLNYNFSGGERKRLELLQALILQPKYAVLDEVDSGMDIDGLEIIKKVVLDLKGKKVGILLITHQPRILRFIKPAKIHVLINGQIVKSGNSEILARLEASGYKSFYCAACLCKQAACPKHRRK